MGVCISIIIATANRCSENGNNEDFVLLQLIESLKASMKNDHVFKNMKKILENNVLRAEFLHTLLTAGGNLCAERTKRNNDSGGLVEDWRAVEKKFVEMLSGTK